MSHIIDSKKLNLLLEEHLPTNRNDIRRRWLIQRIAEASDLYTLEEQDMCTSLRDAVDDSFTLARDAGEAPVCRVSLVKPRADFYFRGEETEVLAKLRHIITSVY